MIVEEGGGAVERWCVEEWVEVEVVVVVEAAEEQTEAAAAVVN